VKPFSLRSRAYQITGWVTAVLLIVGAGYAYWHLHEQKVSLEKEVASLKDSVASLQTDLATSKDEGVKLSEALASEQDKNTNLSVALASEQAKNAAFDAQLRDISGTVGSLQKLSNTDPELLQKYSKVYFLSENYVPAKLAQVSTQYSQDKSRSFQVVAGAEPFLESMLASAAQASTTIQIVSAYRSFDEQAAVKTGYKILYGSGANQFSADQGYSEHQLGTALDFGAPSVSGLSISFESSPAGKWLAENAYKFGFTLSYPKNNSYYQYEPWHWRFVGVGLATTLQNQHKYFYELTQREIDPYLISIFD
jgi:zinc D-Ala-D-Ala carboxypeptidase